MKKGIYLMLLFAVVLPMSFVSCSNAEDGESWDTWIMRNQLNSNWSLDYVKINGEYRRIGDVGFDFFLTMKLRADGRKFEVERFYYKDGVKDESTEVNKSGTYTIDEPNKTIVLIDSEGNKFMRLSNIEFDTGCMFATVLFYDINKTYDIRFDRYISL